MESIDYWYHLMNRLDLTKEDETVSRMVQALNEEYPRLCSLILERACNLQCAHCIFQPEKTSIEASRSVGYGDLACNIISQMRRNPFVIHEGRILRDWHLGLFADIRRTRPDARIGLIDNGTFVQQEKHFRANDVFLDWIDISFDGTKDVHNKQRQSDRAFDLALGGVKRARDFVRAPEQGGKVTSLFTVTNWNYHDVYNIGSFLLGQNLVDEFHITPFSPVRTEIEPLAFCPGYKDGRVDECKILWEQIQRLWGEYNDKNGKRIFVRVYQHADLEKIARAVGVQKFIAAFQNSERVSVDQGSISFEIDDVRVTYVPLSICPSETFVIDADGVYRMAYCLKYTLEELNAGISKEGKDTTPYTVARLTNSSDFHELFHIGVERWVRAFGHDYLAREHELFSRLREM